MAKNQLVYFFGNGKADGTAEMKNLLGGKGANVAEMINLGIPVPPGFTITTEVCTSYYESGNKWPAGLDAAVKDAVKRMEKLLAHGFGSTADPLLVSVRSGARVSMPGMMDTILNLGLNNESVKGLIAKSGNERFAWDSYRRFIQMYSNVVLGLDMGRFEAILHDMKTAKGAKADTDLDAAALQEVVKRYEAECKAQSGKPFPQNVDEQLSGAIDAVFSSWHNRRAIEYRRINGIPEEWGTAVTVQAMVFGNMGDDSATGVAFTRDPGTGEDRIIGEYLVNAQGEDVVAGIRTPQQITEEHRVREGSNLPSMEATMSTQYNELQKVMKRLEKHYKYPQDVEFTIQSGKLFLLQTRNAKRTAQAGLRWAVDLEHEKSLGWEDALASVQPEDIERIFHPFVDPKHEANAKAKTLGKGLAGSPGAYAGRVVFDPDTAVTWAGRGEKVVLVRKETSPDDIHGMHVSMGFLTAVGGMTSHAVLVARQMGKTCVAGCGEQVLRVDYDRKVAHLAGDKTLREGDWITLDGNVGRFIEGVVPTVEPKPDERFNAYMVWVDKLRRLRVRANADTPEQATRARELGAEGIGLCRTEHMFFAEDRIGIVKDMILNINDPDRRGEALDKLLPLQKADFLGIFRAMKGLPVTVRLLDPPLHEFLPNHLELVKEITQLRATGGDVHRLVDLEGVIRQQEGLHEANPMLGHRGCRLAITFPDIYEMQVRAIIEAACELKQEGQDIIPEIMIPLVGHVNELSITRKSAEAVAAETVKKYGVKLDYKIGTMIEVPRACLTADDIAREADFFSFGTNDLTQMTFGFSRDDIGKFLPVYLSGLDAQRDGRKQPRVFDRDPFVAIDQNGVGKLMRAAVEAGRGVKSDLKIGICGEHGGEPSSVIFCHDLGLDYVSCSPLRVPVARAAGAHAVLRERKAMSTAARVATAVKEAPGKIARAIGGAVGKLTGRFVHAAVSDEAPAKKAASAKPAAKPAPKAPVQPSKPAARPAAQLAGKAKAPAGKAPSKLAKGKPAKPSAKPAAKPAAKKPAAKSAAKPSAKSIKTSKPASKPAAKAAKKPAAKAPSKATAKAKPRGNGKKPGRK